MYPAKQLLPQQKANLAIRVLAGTETVSLLAREHEVSRKFLYQQAHTASRPSAMPSPLFRPRGGSLLPAGHHGLAAATGSSLGADLP